MIVDADCHISPLAEGVSITVMEVFGIVDRALDIEYRGAC